MNNLSYWISIVSSLVFAPGCSRRIVFVKAGRLHTETWNVENNACSAHTHYSLRKGDTCETYTNVWSFVILMDFYHRKEYDQIKTIPDNAETKQWVWNGDKWMKMNNFQLNNPFQRTILCTANL